MQLGTPEAVVTLHVSSALRDLTHRDLVQALVAPSEGVQLAHVKVGKDTFYEGGVRE